MNSTAIGSNFTADIERNLSSHMQDVCQTLQTAVDSGVPSPFTSTVASVAFNSVAAIFIGLVNLIVIITIRRKEELRTAGNLILTSMAVSDFLVGAVVQLSKVVHKILHLLNSLTSRACLVKQISAYTGTMCVYASLFNVAFFAFDRVFATVLPYRYLEDVIFNRYAATTLSAWFLLALMSLLTGLGVFQPSFLQQVGRLLFAGAVLLILVSYSLIYWIIRRQKRRVMWTPFQIPRLVIRNENEGVPSNSPNNYQQERSACEEARSEDLKINSETVQQNAPPHAAAYPFSESSFTDTFQPGNKENTAAIVHQDDERKTARIQNTSQSASFMKEQIPAIHIASNIFTTRTVDADSRLGKSCDTAEAARDKNMAPTSQRASPTASTSLAFRCSKYDGTGLSRPASCESQYTDDKKNEAYNMTSSKAVLPDIEVSRAISRKEAGEGSSQLAPPFKSSVSSFGKHADTINVTFNRKWDTALVHGKISCYLPVSRATSPGAISLGELGESASEPDQNAFRSAMEVLKRKARNQTVLWITGAFMVCYLPTVVVNAVKSRHVLSGTTLMTAYDWTNTIVLLNSAINPIIYCWRVGFLRREMKKTLRKLFYPCKSNTN